MTMNLNQADVCSWQEERANPNVHMWLRDKLVQVHKSCRLGLTVDRVAICLETRAMAACALISVFTSNHHSCDDFTCDSI